MANIIKVSEFLGIKITDKQVYDGLEDNFQITAAMLFNYSGLLWFHAANERKTSKAAGAKLKQKGVKSGVPDILCLDPRGKYSGLALELKTKANKPTPNQREWLAMLEGKKYLSLWCNSLEEVERIIEYYCGL